MMEDRSTQISQSKGDVSRSDKIPRMAARTRAVVVHYGDPELTIRAVSSIRAGSVAPGLIVVVDNSPVPFPDPPHHSVPAMVVRPGQNTGFAGGVTIGLEYAPQFPWELAWLLNNDAYAQEDAFTELLEAMARADGRALISSLIRDEATGDVWFEQTRFLPWRMESRGRRLATPLGAELTETRRPSWRSMPYVSGTSLLVPSAAFTAIGGFDRSFFMYSEDVDLSTRSLRAGFALVVAPRSVVVHRTSSGTHIRHRERMVSETSFRLTAKYYPWLLPPAIVLAFATALKRSIMRRQALWMTERFGGYRDALKSRRR
jgi:GT2 family glycosyltransferase